MKLRERAYHVKSRASHAKSRFMFSSPINAYLALSWNVSGSVPKVEQVVQAGSGYELSMHEL